MYIKRLAKDVDEEEKISNELNMCIEGEWLLGIRPTIWQKTTQALDNIVLIKL